MTHSELPPAPPERDIPDGRHRLFRERLLLEIQPENRAENRVENRRPIRRTVLTGMAAGVTGIAVAGVLIAPQFVPSSNHSSPAAVTPSATSADKPQLSDIRDNQWIYVKTQGAQTRYAAEKGGATFESSESFTWETWIPVRFDPSREPVYRDSGGWLRVSALPAKTAFERAVQGSYRDISSLPTDSDALLRLAYTNTSPKWKKADRDEAVAESLRALLSESLLPPKIQAALYEAYAKLPGITVVPSVTDAAGRNGTGLKDPDPVLPTIYIFDKKTSEYLGKKSYEIIAGTAVPVQNSAVVTRAVVNKAYELPATATGSAGPTGTPR